MLTEAKNTGAMALFGEKYGDKVRVVTMGDFSKEFCAGTHVPHTGVIKAFKIISETGVAAGIRRIEALTGDGVMKYYLDEEKTLHEAAKAAKAEPHKLAEKIQSMLDEIKALSAENEKLKDQIAKSEVADVMDQVVEAGDYKVLPVSVKDVDMNALRTLGDDLKGKIGSGVVILASDMGGKVNLIVTATDDAVKAGAHAGKIIKRSSSLSRWRRRWTSRSGWWKESSRNQSCIRKSCGNRERTVISSGLPQERDAHKERSQPISVTLSLRVECSLTAHIQSSLYGEIQVLFFASCLWL